MSELFRWDLQPSDLDGVSAPVLIVALDGWIDAGFGAANAMATLLRELPTTQVGSFDADALLDHRARRPVLHLVDGVSTRLTWPSIDLHLATDATGRSVLLLAGAEPDHAWRAFTQAVTDLAVRFGTRLVVGLGAYPAATPHTRPTRLSVTAADPTLAEAWGYLRGTLDVPAGVQAAIEASCTEHGIPAAGLWAQVPHYTAAMPYPAASTALLRGIERVGGLTLSKGDLADEEVAARQRIDDLIGNNPEHLQMIATLEQEFASESTGELRAGDADELAAEVERFLREQGPTE